MHACLLRVKQRGVHKNVGEKLTDGISPLGGMIATEQKPGAILVSTLPLLRLRNKTQPSDGI